MAFLTGLLRRIPLIMAPRARNAEMNGPCGALRTTCAWSRWTFDLSAEKGARQVVDHAEQGIDRPLAIDDVEGAGVFDQELWPVLQPRFHPVAEQPANIALLVERGHDAPASAADPAQRSRVAHPALELQSRNEGVHEREGLGKLALAKRPDGKDSAPWPALSRLLLLRPLRSIAFFARAPH